MRHPNNDFPFRFRPSVFSALSAPVYSLCVHSGVSYLSFRPCFPPEFSTQNLHQSCKGVQLERSVQGCTPDLVPHQPFVLNPDLMLSTRCLLLPYTGIAQSPQIDDLLADLNAVRIHQAEGRCPRGFFLVPTNKETWSWTKRADCFSLYTRNVQLFFVCRMFFEELKTAAAMSDAERNALIARRSEIQYQQEFSEPIPLELPKVRRRQSLPDYFVTIVLHIFACVLRAQIVQRACSRCGCPRGQY